MAPEVLHSASAAIPYYAVYSGWIATFFVERGIIRTARQSSTESRSDRGSSLLIFFGIFNSITIANLYANAGVALLSASFFYIGIVIMIGIAIRMWAVFTLRHFFTYTLQVMQGHQVVEDGPYHLVRHPAYAGSLLTIFGLGLALQSWGAVLLMAVVFGTAIGYRISIEEKALLGSLGDEYAAYSRRTKRLIPFIF